MKKTSTTLYMFSNQITYIEDDFVNDLGSETNLVITCANLGFLPCTHQNTTANIACAPNGLNTIKGLNDLVTNALARSGFTCIMHHVNDNECMVCKSGSYGNGSIDMPGCTKCPPGTNSSQHAGYRACKCIDKFYRLDRFGMCQTCPNKALICKNDYATLSEGYYWKWKNVSHQEEYSSFTRNLEIESSEVLQRNWKFNGTLPRPHKCPRKSCLGGMESSCYKGYEGPLCAVCKTQYYDRMNRCIRCPSSLQAGLQVAGVLIMFVFILFALLWGERKKINGGRTWTDIIMSCFKIIIGFYQVMAGLYSSFSKVEWPPTVIWMEKTLHFIQLNILQFAPLSCVTPKLSFNALEQFVLVSTANVVIVSFILLYLAVRIFQLRRKMGREVDERVTHTKISCIRNICVLLFATYPRTCTSIVQVLSVNCVPLCFDENEEYCESYLRSDFSIKCDAPPYLVYSKVAFVFLAYPIGLPVVILFLVWKYVPRKTASPEEEETELQDIPEENRNYPSGDAILYNPNKTETPFKAGLSLFYENYKPSCWYWEAVEMIRKLVLISGLTLFGKQSRTQIGLGAIISALFAILYVYLRPIANEFENFLQTVALMAIFLNLGIGVMLKISDDEMSPSVNKRNDKVGVSVLLILINTAVVAIVIVACLKILVLRMLRWCRSADHSCHGDECCKVCGMFCMSLLLPSRLDRGDSHHAEMRSRLLEEFVET
ncbi:uncharacterized protein LOC116301752 isoform X2 [Actinia tenebrosa]|uniref:Uncharacterized protein LOC116301752 isoform X2 n=1 Tax=Actinia tenebrosa TaxID=6105 RepID=A0A6P8IJV9_ACTTE|nr:uncharacterized protein LOC116301752 isoform X2 [Actinia tenebrosa]